MKLKGTMVMELTDVNTGEVITITEENMVTNAVNDILGTNPMGVFYCEADYSTGTVWTGNLLPICPNMIGGILLFSKALEEKADNIYPSSDNLPVAYASNNVNSKYDDIAEQIESKKAKRELFKGFIHTLEKQDGLTCEFDAGIWSSLVQEVSVKSKDDIRFIFQNGFEVRV